MYVFTPQLVCKHTVERVSVCCLPACLSSSPWAPRVAVCGLSNLSSIRSGVSGWFVLAGMASAWVCLGLPVIRVLQGRGPCDPGPVAQVHPIHVGRVRWV